MASETNGKKRSEEQHIGELKEECIVLSRGTYCLRSCVKSPVRVQYEDTMCRTLLQCISLFNYDSISYFCKISWKMVSDAEDNWFYIHLVLFIVLNLRRMFNVIL